MTYSQIIATTVISNKFFPTFFGSTEQATRTLRILDAFYLPVEVEPGDETPRKKLKGISVMEVGDTLLNIGFALDIVPSVFKEIIIALNAALWFFTFKIKDN